LAYPQETVYHKVITCQPEIRCRAGKSPLVKDRHRNQ